MARRRERGGLFTGWLVLIMVSSGFGVVTSCTGNFADHYAQSQDDSVVAVVGMVWSAAVFIAALATWWWKRTGVKALLAFGLLGAVLSLIGGEDDVEKAGGLIGGLIGTGLLWLFVKPIWPLFNGGEDDEDDEDDGYDYQDEQTCPECGEVNSGTAIRCNCGYSFVRERKERECPKCGRFNPTREGKCRCGHVLRRRKRSQSGESRGT